MKFSQKIHKLILFSFLLFFSSVAVAGSVRRSSENTEIAALELEEFKESSNLEVKEKLARAYWCAHKKGLAVEKWLWLNQFFRNHPRRPQWRRHLDLAKKNPQKLRQELACSD